MNQAHVQLDIAGLEPSSVATRIVHLRQQFVMVSNRYAVEK